MKKQLSLCALVVVSALLAQTAEARIYAGNMGAPIQQTASRALTGHQLAKLPKRPLNSVDEDLNGELQNEKQIQQYIHQNEKSLKQLHDLGKNDSRIPQLQATIANLHSQLEHCRKAQAEYRKYQTANQQLTAIDDQEEPIAAEPSDSE